MGKRVVHCGEAGNGQAAKICNNMILGISMIAVSEAFVLGEKLGLSHQALFDVASASSGQCWSLTSYCPVPGPVPASPANNDYKPGFAAALMLKDLKLAHAAAQSVHADTALGAQATEIYETLRRRKATAALTFPRSSSTCAGGHRNDQRKTLMAGLVPGPLRALTFKIENAGPDTSPRPSRRRPYGRYFAGSVGDHSLIGEVFS